MHKYSPFLRFSYIHLSFSSSESNYNLSNISAHLFSWLAKSQRSRNGGKYRGRGTAHLSSLQWRRLGPAKPRSLNSLQSLTWRGRIQTHELLWRPFKMAESVNSTSTLKLSADLTASSLPCNAHSHGGVFPCEFDLHCHDINAQDVFCKPINGCVFFPLKTMQTLAISPQWMLFVLLTCMCFSETLIPGSLLDAWFVFSPLGR